MENKIVCRACKEPKFLSEYHKSTTNKYGHQTACKKCSKEFRKKYYQENKEKELAINKKWRDEHKEEMAFLVKEWTLLHPDSSKQAQSRYRAKYGRLVRNGIRDEDYFALFWSQNKSCAICGEKKDETYKKWALDHDHACCPANRSCPKCIRGILCMDCNMALGSFKDDVKRMRKAIEYLGNLPAQKVLKERGYLNE